MGTYYTIVCHAKREFIDPGKVGGGNIKQSFVHGSAGNLVAHAMIDRWYGHGAVTIEGDHAENLEAIRDYVDVTREAVAAFNASASHVDDTIEYNENG